MIIVIVLLFYLFNQKNVGKMSNVNRDGIKNLIYNTYKINVNTIHNLIEIASLNILYCCDKSIKYS